MTVKKNRLFVIFAITGAALLLLLVGWSSAQPQVEETTAPRREAAVTEVVTTTFSYQGVLEESGEPVSGNRQMVFSLYEDGACTTQVGDALTETVSIEDGLFDVELGYDHAHFDGKALWLETEVAGTAIGCQPFQATPYALSLRPGAVISAAIGDEEHLLHARSGTTGPDEGVLGAKVGFRSSLGYPVGVKAYAYDFGSVGLWGVSDSQFGWGVNGVAEGPESVGVRGIANAFTSTTYGVYGEANSPDGHAGRFEHTAVTGDGVALSAVGPRGGVITSTDGTGLSVSASGGNGGGDDGVYGEHASGDGVVGFSDGPDDLDNGVIGFTDGGYGIYGFSNAAGQYGGYFADDIFVGGGCTGCTLSYVARNTSDKTLQIGEMVQTEGVDTQLAGAQQPVMQVTAAETNEQVLGVVVGRTEMTMVEPGADDAQPGPHYGPTGGAAEPGDYLIIVVQGMAQVRLDAATGIQAGDKIGLSADGTAQAVDASSLGMALEQPDENGLAWVLIGLD
jgi:hypothetical protein